MLHISIQTIRANVLLYVWLVNIMKAAKLPKAYITLVK